MRAPRPPSAPPLASACSRISAPSGLGSAPNLAHLHQQDPTGGRGANPHIVDEKTASSLGPPKSRDELQRIQAQLNDDERPQMSRPNSSMEGNAGEL